VNLLILVTALFGLGLYGVLTRRDIIAVLASIEVLMGASILMLVGLPVWSSAGADARSEALALLVLVLAAAEAAVGLALLVVVAQRTRKVRIDELTEVKG